MYCEHSIDELSKPQISRLLNGHGVRVRHGGHHHIQLSHDQSKKHHKTAMHGKGYTINFDPFQIANHQHLRGGSLSYDKFANNPNVKRIAAAATDRAVKEIGGSLSYDKFANNPNIKRIASAATDRAVKGIAGGSLSYDKFANNPNVKRIAAAATDRAVKEIGGSLSYDKFANNPNVKRIAAAATDRAVKEIGGSLSYDKFANNPNVKRIAAAATDRAVKGIAGGSVNRINKFNRWTGALGQAYQGIARAVAPVAKPIFQAGTEAAVSYINPTPEDLLMQSMGGGIRKRGRPRKHGGALHQSGSTGGKVHRKKKHGLLFDL